MHKFGHFITKYKNLVLIISVILLISAIIGMKATRINYDMLTYLPKDIDTVKGKDILKNVAKLNFSNTERILKEVNKQ